MNDEDKLAIFQNKNGAIDLKIDASAETIWATQAQMAELFQVDRSRITRHINNVLKDGEIDTKSNVRKTHIAKSDRPVSLYSLDMILAVGYRTNSSVAIKFRKWATKTLKAYIADGYAINPSRIEHNKSQFLKALDDMKLLASDVPTVGSSEAVDLAAQFARTWFSLDAYDKADLPSSGGIKRAVELGAHDLEAAIQDLRRQLINNNEATELFAQPKHKDGLQALFGNVFQSFAGEDVYPTLEEKAAHLLYFVVKNHVFNDGNKRSGAFAFVWFLKEVGLLNTAEISPQALTAITLLVAESDPKQKDKMIGLILLLLGVEK